MTDQITPLDGVVAFKRIPEPERISKFKFEDFDTLQPGRQQWLVKGLWPSVGVCFLAGPSMAGKSFLALDLCVKVIRGQTVLGRKSKPCGVVYIAAEGAAGVRNRITGLRQRTGPVGGLFQFIGQAPDLTYPDDVDELRQGLIAQKAAFEARGDRLGLIVVDTLSASVPGADENTAKDMSPVLTALQSMSIELGAMVLVIAHTGKNADAGIRGWSGLLANADGLIMLSKAEGDETRTGTVEKVKDGRSGDRFAFALDSVVIGVDEDGDEITTCTVVETDMPEGKALGPDKLTPNASSVLTALGYLIDNGQSIQTPNLPGVPAWAKAVDNETLRNRLWDTGFSDPEAKPGTVRQRYRDAKILLQTKGYIRIEGETIIWLGKRSR